MDRRLFALDQGFPLPIVRVLTEYMTEAELVPFAEIDPQLADLDDWEVLLSLHHHKRPWDGLITTDDMIWLPRELAVLMQTNLTLVVAEEAGHDPLKATGLVFAHLPGICKRTRPEVAQLWVLRAVARPHTNPWTQFKRVADHQSTDANNLFRDAKLSPNELAPGPSRQERALARAASPLALRSNGARGPRKTVQQGTSPARTTARPSSSDRGAAPREAIEETRSRRVPSFRPWPIHGPNLRKLTRLPTGGGRREHGS